MKSYTSSPKTHPPETKTPPQATSKGAWTSLGHYMTRKFVPMDGGHEQEADASLSSLQSSTGPYNKFGQSLWNCGRRAEQVLGTALALWFQQ